MGEHETRIGKQLEDGLDEDRMGWILEREAQAVRPMLLHQLELLPVLAVRDAWVLPLQPLDVARNPVLNVVLKSPEDVRKECNALLRLVRAHWVNRP